MSSIVIHKDFLSKENEINKSINDFSSSGIVFGDGQRNKIKLFDLDGQMINIKSFKVPNFINQIAYKYFRKSKPDVRMNMLIGYWKME